MKVRVVLQSCPVVQWLCHVFHAFLDYVSHIPSLIPNLDLTVLLLKKHINTLTYPRSFMTHHSGNTIRPSVALENRHQVMLEHETGILTGFNKLINPKF